MAPISAEMQSQLGVDVFNLSEIMYASASFCTQNEVLLLISQMQKICGFDYAILAMIKETNNLTYQPAGLINHSYPNQWLEIYQRESFTNIDPVFLAHARNPGTRRWKDTYLTKPPPSRFLSTAKEFGLYDGWTIGLPNRNGQEISLMSFSWKNNPPEERHGALLHLAAPHLHQALVRALGDCRAPLANDLTPRESEVVTWLKHGKSNWEIATILNISERTVKFHIGNIMSKLNAVNRGHAVAQAIVHGL